jgi:hypothetical protein
MKKKKQPPVKSRKKKVTTSSETVQGSYLQGECYPGTNSVSGGRALRAFCGEFLMLRRRALSAPGRDGGDIGLEALLLGAVGAGGQLEEGVEGNFHPGRLLLGNVHEVGVDAAQNGLVGDDDDVLAALEFHDDGLQADDHVAIRLTAAVAVVVLVFIAGGEVLRVLLGNFLVGEAIADAGVQFVEGLPFQLFEAGFCLEVAGGLDGAAEGGGPNDDFGVGGNARLAEELWQLAGVGLAALGNVGVTTNFAGQVELRFTVLWGSC